MKTAGLKVRQDPSANCWPFFHNPLDDVSKSQMVERSFFLMLDIAKLRSIQYQDTDIRISDPTDLAAKLPSNLILIMLDMVRKR